MRTWALGSAIALVACGEGASTGPGAADAVVVSELADRVAPDVAPPADMASPPADSAPEADLAPPPPDASPPDLALPVPAADAWPLFRYGIHDEDREKMVPTPVFHVDHDPEEHPEASATCTNYAGQHFPFCYDGHRGSDFLLRGGFVTMDDGSARIVAAAGGIVEHVEDGHYDRCHGSAESLDVTCDGNEMRANYVRLRHANGWNTLYYHMKKGSPVVRVGQRVRCGEVLGLVGSSGVSTLPHLHFQVEDPAGNVMDPFAGPESQPVSMFTEQAATDNRPGSACDPAWTDPPAE